MKEFESLTRRRILLEATPVLALVVLGCAGKPKPIEKPVVTVDDALGHLRRNIRRHVEDKQRRKRALAKLDELRVEVADMDHLAYVWRMETLAALERGDAENLSMVSERMNMDYRAALRRTAKIGVELREHISASEWPRVFEAPEEKAA